MTQVPGEPDIMHVDEPEAVPIEAATDAPHDSEGADGMAYEREFLDVEMVDEPDIVDRG